MNVGIIGYGRIGAEHAAWLSGARGITAVAAADATETRRELARQRGLRAVESVEQLLGDAAIDAVLVAVPTSLHLECARAALAAGKHVMVEKPMTLDLPEARTLAEQAQQARRVLSVFHNRRWDADYLTVLSAVQGGVLGRVINVESRLGQWASCVGPAAAQWRPQWRTEARWGGGGLYDWGSHFVDQLWRMMWPAKPTRVFAELRGNVWSADCDDFARVCLDFDNGAVGLVEINTTTTRPLPRWHLDGTAGSADSPYSREFDVEKWAQLQFTSADGSGARALAPAGPGLSEIQIWERFAAAVRGEAEPAVTARSVLPTMALLDAARRSSAAGTAVDVRHSVEWVI